MALLAEKMDEDILAFMQLVEFGGHVAQLTLGPDLVEKDRHQLGELLGQVIDRFYRVIEQLGYITLKKIRVFYTGAGQFDIDNERRK